MNTRIIWMVMLLGWVGCQKEPVPERFQGYVEGEFVFIASPLAGQLEILAVQRGTLVEPGTLIFALESGKEKAARDQAARRLEEGQARLADAQKGLRTTEIASLEAQLNQARAALILSEQQLTRQTELTAARASVQQDLDKAKAARDQDYNRIIQLEADLETARLGARSDQIKAAEANIRALQASLAQAEWDLSQKTQISPVAGLVFDTFYQQGEWVPAGRPVISLLPPSQIKVRAFVPEPRIGSLQLGDTASVFVDGVAEPFVGKISFISPQTEFTPPVIYSKETRSKLVIMVEISFEPDKAARLHPGQPVDIKF